MFEICLRILWPINNGCQRQLHFAALGYFQASNSSSFSRFQYSKCIGKDKGGVRVIPPLPHFSTYWPPLPDFSMMGNIHHTAPSSGKHLHGKRDHGLKSLLSRFTAADREWSTTGKGCQGDSAWHVMTYCIWSMSVIVLHHLCHMLYSMLSVFCALFVCHLEECNLSYCFLRGRILSDPLYDPGTLDVAPTYSYHWKVKNISWP